MRMASIAAGAGGLAIEVHYNPAESWVDAQQAITPAELADIISNCNQIHDIVAPKKQMA